MSGGGGKKPPANESGWGDPKDLERAVREAREAREAARSLPGPADPLAERGEGETPAAVAGEIETAAPAQAAIETPALTAETLAGTQTAAEAPGDTEAAADAPADSEAAAEAPADSEAAPPEPGKRAEADEPPASWGEADEPPASWGEADEPPASWGEADEPPTDWGDEDGALPPPASLDEAVGLSDVAPPRKRRLGRRQLLAIVGGSVLLLVAGSIGVASWLNSRRYYLVCGSQVITAERGSTWPWGREALTGDRYRPIPIPASYECVSRELESQDALDDAFLAALIDRASALLTSGDPAAVTEAQAELEQALYLSRDPSRRETRELVERLQGDVEYWQAAAEIQAALDQLEKAAARFEAAAARRPRHNSDATAWAAHARAMGEEIRQGPPALREDAPPASPDGRPHFAGTGDDSPLEALADAGSTATAPPEPGDAEPAEVEGEAAAPAPGEGDAEAAEPSPPAGAADPGAAAAEPAPAEPDAGLPRGGVLL